MKNIVFLYLTGVLLFACNTNEKDDTILDTIKPIVLSTQPVESKKGVPVNIGIIITYNEPIQLGKSVNITINNKNVDVSIIANQLFLDVVLKENTDYVVFISGISILDRAKNYAEEFSFSFSTKVDKPHIISENLVSSNPSGQAVNLYNFLKENYSKKIISSAMANVNWNLNEAEWIKLHAGKYPAIATFDYIHLPFSPANWIDYSVTSEVENWWDNNGIISAGWHWIVPKNEGSAEYTYKPAETSFKASNATKEGTWENAIIKADLEKIAGYLKLLQATNIPIIWRPLHEAAGNIYEYNNGTAWFWWGADGAEAFKQLWIYMFDYFQNQGLNNLIWVWTTQTKDDEFYPGDDYVDIVGKDIYNKTEAEFVASLYTAIRESYPNKIVTLSECGGVASISAQWTSGARWSYFMPWYDFERTNHVNEADFSGTGHEHANANWWKDAMQQDYVITRDEVPNLK